MELLLAEDEVLLDDVVVETFEESKAVTSHVWTSLKGIVGKSEGAMELDSRKTAGVVPQ